MKIHEFQAKEILRGYGVPVPKGGVAEIAEEARKIAEATRAKMIVVKAQIHAGGRGKGGGVKWSARQRRPKRPPKRYWG
jgi:succinyl-CoA synthetase beta subunit